EKGEQTWPGNPEVLHGAWCASLRAARLRSSSWTRDSRSPAAWRSPDSMVLRMREPSVFNPDRTAFRRGGPACGARWTRLGRGLAGQGKAKADVGGAYRGHIVVDAKSTAAANRGGVPAAAAQRARQAGGGAERVFPGALLVVIRRKPIRGPLPDVAVHVV